MERIGIGQGSSLLLHPWRRQNSTARLVSIKLELQLPGRKSPAVVWPWMKLAPSACDATRCERLNWPSIGPHPSSCKDLCDERVKTRLERCGWVRVRVRSVFPSSAFSRCLLHSLPLFLSFSLSLFLSVSLSHTHTHTHSLTLLFPTLSLILCLLLSHLLSQSLSLALCLSVSASVSLSLAPFSLLSPCPVSILM